MIRFFDEAFPVEEQLPRRMEVSLTSESHPQGERVRMTVNGRAVGDPLTDMGWLRDAYTEGAGEAGGREVSTKAGSRCPPDVTGARWHDTLHVAFAACLGWSPALRTLASFRRRSDPGVDRQQDGGDAVRAEEEIALEVFCHARLHDPYQGRPVDPELLASVREKIRGLEVSACSDAQWAHAISSGIVCMQAMWASRGGTLTADLTARSLVYSRPREHAGAAA
jgi:hypothetical protein